MSFYTHGFWAFVVAFELLRDDIGFWLLGSLAGYASWVKHIHLSVLYTWLSDGVQRSANILGISFFKLATISTESILKLDFFVSELLNILLFPNSAMNGPCFDI